MTTHTTRNTPTRTAERHDPAYQAFLLLRVAFTVAPIVFGLDKFFNLLTDWPGYLAPWIDSIVPGTAQQAMYVVGVVEMFARRPQVQERLTQQVADWLQTILGPRGVGSSSRPSTCA